MKGHQQSGGAAHPARHQVRLNDTLDWNGLKSRGTHGSLKSPQVGSKVHSFQRFGNTMTLKDHAPPEAAGEHPRGPIRRAAEMEPNSKSYGEA